MPNSLSPGLSEWTRSWHDRESGRRWVAGGSWADSDPLRFQSHHASIVYEWETFGACGFRLAARRR